MNDPKKFVALLELDQPSTELNLNLFESGLQDMEEGAAESYVDNKSLVSFVSEVSAQNRKDILNSTLLAQRAADKKFPDPVDVIKWYETYIDVLTNIGWVIESQDFSKFSSENTLFEMEDVVISILTAMVGQNYIAIIKSTLDALKSLSDDDNKIKLFESNTHNFQKGNFQIGLANEHNGAVTMQIGAFMVSSTDEIKRILFFNAGKDKSELSYYAIRCTLNDEIYSIVRNDILAKLGNSVSSYIAKLW